MSERDRLIALALQHGAMVGGADGPGTFPARVIFKGDTLEAFAAALSQPHASEQGAAPDLTDDQIDGILYANGWTTEADDVRKVQVRNSFRRTLNDAVRCTPHASAQDVEDWESCEFPSCLGKSGEPCKGPCDSPHAPAPVQAAPTEPTEGQIEEWRDKAADYDRLATVARNRRHVLEEIAGSRPLTATPQQFADHLQRLAKKAGEDYTFAGNDAATPADTRVCHRDDRCLTCPRYHGKAEHCSVATREKATEGAAVVTVHRGGLGGQWGKGTFVVRWEEGAKSLPDGEHKLYAAPQAAKGDGS